VEKQQFQIRVKNRLNELETIRRVVEQMPETVCFSKRKRCEIHLILEELFTNIVNHGFTDEKEHEIHIELRCNHAAMTIRMEDDGPPFNPTESCSPDTGCALEERLVGGLGIHFVKHFIDTCTYERKNGKNIMVLQKRLQDSDRSSDQCRDRKANNPQG